MIARRTTTLLLVMAQVTTAVYLVVYLARWQWNRAVICGVLLLATEVLLIGRLVLQRLRAIEERLAARPDEAVRLRLVQHRPEPKERFAWMRDATTRSNVFLPVLLGAGVLASAVAWAVETVARRTAGPVLERSLTSRLAPLAFPDGGFLAAAPATDVPPVPARRTARLRAVLAGAAVAIVVGVGGLVDVVADATQTRPDHLDAGVTTIVDLRLRGAHALGDPTRHAANLVQTCTSQSFRREIPIEGVTAVDAETVRVVLGSDLGEHGTTRLRGCLEDVTIDRIQANVSSLTEVYPDPSG